MFAFATCTLRNEAVRSRPGEVPSIASVDKGTRLAHSWRRGTLQYAPRLVHSTVECEIICTGFGVVSLLLPESEFTCMYSSLPGPTLLAARFRSSRSGVSGCGSTPSSSFSSEVTSGLACNQPKHKDSWGDVIGM